MAEELKCNFCGELVGITAVDLWDNFLVFCDADCAAGELRQRRWTVSKLNDAKMVEMEVDREIARSHGAEE